MKINAKLPEYLTEFPSVAIQTHSAIQMPDIFDLPTTLASLQVDRSVPEIAWCAPGEAAAHRWMSKFVDERLAKFHSHRNNPTVDATSHLSPWLHFGHLSPQRCALAMRALQNRHTLAVASFQEEIIVRRELADNYCYYNQRYDDYASAPAWARDTLKKHESDPRPIIYSQQCFVRVPFSLSLCVCVYLALILTLNRSRH
jgi:deoxyribodipyrimidine photo-lyase